MKAALAAATPAADIEALGPFLERLVHRYDDPALLGKDPLGIVYDYADPGDREVAAIVAAGLAYGRVDIILANARDALRRMGPSPRGFVSAFEPSRDARRFDGWVHRFNRGIDLAALCLGLRQVYAEHENAGDFFAAGYDPVQHSDIRPALVSFVDRFLALDFSPLYPAGRLPLDAGVRWFFASPEGGSPCKRLNLLLRWMVRRDLLDLGLWPQVDPAHLVMPVDTHIGRISGYLGLTTRNTLGWQMAMEITQNLRRLDARDPIRFDWAICRLGILQHCPRRRDPVLCTACPLFTVCRA